MSQTYTHTCSCGKKYKDVDPDPYFCSECVIERKKIAAQIDRQMAGKPSKRKVLTDYQIAISKGITKGQGTFVKASDLGINFN